MSFTSGTYVWVPDADDVVIPAKVETTFSPGSAATVTRLDNNRTVKLSAEETEPIITMHAQSLEPLPDMVGFKELHEFSILHNLRLRFANNDIYTSIGRILTSVNPFKQLPIYSPEIMEEYMKLGSRKLPPHVYGVADDAFNAMISTGESQSCIVSGESGAGKTEATKVFLQYISEKSKRAVSSNSESTRQEESHDLQQKILESNPILEAFGNAKTVRNDNSSRFGKWIEVQFDSKSGGIKGASIKSYLLEKSRIVSMSENERNYHIFYQLCTAAEVDPELQKYNLTDATQYYYLNQSEEPCTKVAKIDDLQEWNATVNAFEKIGVDSDKRDELINILNIVLTVGNITFEGKDKAVVGGDSKDTLKKVAEGLGVEEAALERALVKVDRSNPADPDLVGDHDLSQSCDARDAFAKHIYSLMFDWIIVQINLSLGKVSGENISTIGVLDIFGFEFFKVNSFEQLCINYCNERLQGHFNDHIFKLEQQQYESEGIDVTKIDFVDNENVIKTIDSKGGILQVIADTLKTRKATDEMLLKKLYKKADDSKKDKDERMRNVISYPKAKEVKKNPHLNNSFYVQHFAGQVNYMIENFLEKNRDSVPALLQKLGEKAGNAFIKQLFTDVGKVKKKALGLRFSSQLKDLMGDLKKTEPHFVRCVKPCAEKQPGIFTAHMVLDQLRYAGLLEVCRIRKMGYPVRREHEEFFKRYRPLVDGRTSNHTEVVAGLIKQGLATDKDLQIGKSKVFMKTDQADTLEEKRAQSLGRFVTIMQKVVRGYLKRIVYQRFGKIRSDLKEAIKTRDKDILKQALLQFGELPYGGKHLVEYKEAIELMNKIEDEERIIKLLKDAIESRDANQINAALKAAEEKDLGKLKEANDARMLGELIEREQLCLKSLKEALDKKDENMVKNALKQAKALNISDQFIDDAENFLKHEEKVRFARDNLESSIKAGDVEGIKKFMNQMADIGREDDPLVKQGEEIVKEKAKADAEVLERKEEVLFKWNKAVEERNLQALNELEGEVIDLGLEGEEIQQGRELRDALFEEKDICAKLSAESTAVQAKAQTRLGLVASDLDDLRQLIEDATKVLLPDDFQLLSAQEELHELEEQLKMQEEITQTLAEYNERKQKVVKIENKEEREKEVADLLEMLKSTQMQAQEKGVEFAAVSDVREKLNQLQEEVAEKKKAEHQAEREANIKRMENATEEDIEAEQAKRQQFTDVLSNKHQQLIAEASDARRYALHKFYRIRTDEDYVEKVPREFKASAAEMKLVSRPKPINRSLCRLDDEQSKLAVKLNKALLHYCGDLASNFAATQAQFILMKALEDPSLTDEIYVQILKHLTGNEKPDSEDKAWLMLCLCTKTFPPSTEFAPYLLHYLISRKTQPGLVGNYARLCIVQLDATLELGATWFKPSIEEIGNYKKRPPILATIETLDGKHVDYAVTPDMRVSRVLELVRKKENIDDDSQHPTWGIYVLAEDENDNENPKERLIRFYQHYNPSKIAHVELFLDHWKGNTEELFQKLTMKYGPEPAFDDKARKKGMLALPITAAINAVKFLGFANQRDQPPAPQTPWPLPWWTHLGDVYFRMTKQRKIPKFIFKRKMITRTEDIDRWLYLQAVDDIRKGYMPMSDPETMTRLSALALREEKQQEVDQNLSVDGLISIGLEKFVSEEILDSVSIRDVARGALSLYNNNTLPKEKEAIWDSFVTICREQEIYAMNFFYARHAASEKNYVIAVDVEGIHVLENDRSGVKRSFSFNTIKKFGATAEYFWMNIDEKPEEKKKSKLAFLSQNQGINVLLYTLQSWEMYDTVYDATHIELDDDEDEEDED
eukprot:augustus_masked-scaffold_9-processed-gene-6.5-mRNA-1 protein AED:0.07 eAED:0.07 QI:0/-1/0/1/-1/1/1/0/1819